MNSMIYVDFTFTMWNSTFHSPPIFKEGWQGILFFMAYSQAISWAMEKFIRSYGEISIQRITIHSSAAVIRHLPGTAMPSAMSMRLKMYGGAEAQTYGINV